MSLSQRWRRDLEKGRGAQKIGLGLVLAALQLFGSISTVNAPSYSLLTIDTFLYNPCLKIRVASWHS